MSEVASPARQKWLEVIERQQTGGSSVAAFCRQRGLAPSSFFAWKRKLGAAPQAPAFVEARIADASTRSRAWSAGMIEVRLRGGRRVRVSRGFDRDLLGALVAALEAIP
jgi:transposase-like protein